MAGKKEVDLNNSDEVRSSLEKIEHVKPSIIQQLPDAVRDLFEKEFNAFKASCLTNREYPMTAEVIVKVEVDVTKHTMGLSMNVPVHWPDSKSACSVALKTNSADGGHK